MIATEVSEALRNAHYLSKHTSVLLNTFSLKPAQTRKEIKEKSLNYPSVETVASNLNQLTQKVYTAQASDISMKHFGSYLATNPVLVGMALAWKLLPLKKKLVKRLLKGDAAAALELGFKSPRPK